MNERGGTGVASRIGSVRDRIAAAAARAGRDPSEVTLVAVSKAWPAEAVGRAYAAGQRAFGENYVQEWLAKRDRLADLAGIDWHFIGHLQSRKAREVVGKAAWIESVDRLDLARELSRRAAAAGASVRCLLQVNVGREASKGGFDPDEVIAATRVAAGLPALDPRGLMAIPPPGGRPEDSRPWFRALRDLRDRVRDETGFALPDLSMGMSGDFEVAIEEGATLVRVGTAIFGER